MINLTYSLIFGKWDLALASGTSSWSTRGADRGLGGPTLVGAHSESWQLDGLAKILAR